MYSDTYHTYIYIYIHTHIHTYIHCTSYIYWEFKLVRPVSLKIAPAVVNEFIVIADFGDFREVKHLLIIFSLYRFEFHTKTLIFTVFEISNFLLTKQHLREILIFCFN